MATGCASLFRGSLHWAWGHWLLGLVFVTLALVAPQHLKPLNRAWFRLGLLMGQLARPLVLGVLFFGLITPVACLGRWMGRDELRLRRRARISHWISRDVAGPAPETYGNQF